MIKTFTHLIQDKEQQEEKMEIPKIENTNEVRNIF